MKITKNIAIEHEGRIMQDEPVAVIDWDNINLEDIKLCKIDDPACTSCE